MKGETAALQDSRRLRVRAVPLRQPLRWLQAGWRDLLRAPVPGLLHGAALAVFGAALFWTARNQFWWLAGAFSGFLLVAPVLATGLYALSRAMERGSPATLATALGAWRPRHARRVIFGLLLALAGTGWVLTSASLITAFAGSPVRNPAEFMRVVVMAEHGWLFEAWLILGGLLAAPVFASSVVALPLLLDRDIGVLAAVLTSWRVVMNNAEAMALWAAIIMGLTLAGMASALLGLIVVVPWLGHASWHAYRDLIEPGPELGGGAAAADKPRA
jgi:uncharacterized membrane protein